MSALSDLGEAIDRALKEHPVEDVLSIITGVFVGLTIGLVKHYGNDPEKAITINGGAERDITIHAPKKVSAP